MQEQLISMLQKAELGLSEEPLTAIEIADIIWLATHLWQKQPQNEPNPIPTKTQDNPNNKQNKQVNGEKKNNQENNDKSREKNKNQEKDESPSSDKVDEVAIVTQQSSSPMKGKSLPFQVPATTAIPNSRKIARSLRSLNRKVPSKTREILDVSKTIYQTAEAELCIPILKPAMQRWLDVMLIIETSPSFGIWQQTIKEFKNLLLLQGSFRDVKCWYASLDDDGQLDFRSQQGTRRNPKELILPNRDRLIIILSDCVSSAWYSNLWSDWIEVFGKYHPVTLLQMLPPSFWRRTALGQMDSVWLSSNTPGALNHHWNAESATPWEEESNNGFPVPIVTLDPYALEVWAKAIVGTSTTQLAGVYFQGLNLPEKKENSPQNSLSTEEKRKKQEQLFEQFMTTASPTARRLAALLSAVPVQLPIVRLIQRSLLRQTSNAVHVAEVFFSGILHRINEDKDPEKRLYDFEEGLRERLNETLSKQEILSVIDRISAYIAKRVGVSIREFRAMLAIPSEEIDSPLASEISEFARISKQVLECLGKEYADFVAILNQGEIYASDLDVVLKNNIDEVVTIEIKLAFKVVTLVDKEKVDNRPKIEDIYFSKEISAPTASVKSLYQSYQELSDNEQEGVDYRIRSRQTNSDVAILAPHGGKIQPGSTEIADAIAGEDYNFYSFEGIKQDSDNDALYLRSDHFDEPLAVDMVGKANRVITIHGFAKRFADYEKDHIKDKNEQIYLGGLDNELKKSIRKAFIKADFRNVLENSPYFGGKAPKNICNRGKTGKGVQIALSWGLRQKLFDSLKSETKEPTLFDRFVQAIRDALSPLEAAGWRYQTSEGLADYFTEQLPEDVELDMVSIPGGTFWMGTDDEEIERLVKKFDQEYFREESPQHQVNIEPFYMGCYPITQGQWKAIASRTDLQVNPDINLDPEPSEFKDDPLQPPLQEGEAKKTRWDRPVEQVNWYEAKEFCDRLSKLTGKQYRLPTEAEWEYACRAVVNDSSSVESKDITQAEWNQKYQQPFHFGDTITADLANYYAKNTYEDEPKGEYREQTTPVGYFGVANAFGLYDMHGNILEWCEDDYQENYKGAPNDGTAWLKTQNSNPDNKLNYDENKENEPNKVIRGGSWLNYPYGCRCAFRYFFNARDYYDDVGFRVVCAPPRT